MQRSSVSESRARPGRPDLDRLDAALGRLRRFWENPDLRRWFVAQLGRPVEPTLVRTLRAVEAAADPEVGVRDVAQVLRIDHSTASRLVDQAVSGGYVQREMSQRDRRRCVLALTAEGRALLQRATEVRGALLAQLTADWSSDDVATLAEQLERLAQSMAEWAPAS